MPELPYALVVHLLIFNCQEAYGKVKHSPLFAITLFNYFTLPKYFVEILLRLTALTYSRFRLIGSLWLRSILTRLREI